MCREGEGVAWKVLSNLGVELQKVRQAVEFIIGRGERPVTGDIGPTPRAKQVVALARDEGRRVGHAYVGTEHLLLGMIREGIAAGVLESMGVNLEKVRKEVINILTYTGGAHVSTSQAQYAGPGIVQGGGPAPEGDAHRWQYLVIPTVVHGDMIEVAPFYTRDLMPYDLPGLRIAHAMEILGEDGWELVAIDEREPMGTEHTRLFVQEGTKFYVFKHPRRDPTEPAEDAQESTE